MEPNSDFWTYLFIGVGAVTLIAVVIGVIALKLLVFRPAERRAKREADADGSYGPMERTELVSLIQKLDDRNEENIVAREIAKHKFLADFRHELLEPVNSIKRESSVLSQYLQDDSVAAAARGIHRSATRLEGLMMDLYELYTLEVGRARLMQENVFIDNVVEDLEKHFKSISHDTHNSLEVKVGSVVRSFVTDSIKFNKLLRSMVEVANSYTTNGIILVDIGYAEDGRLQIRVADDGDGIHDENRQDWSGLRLPLSKKLAEFLGGGFEILETRGGGAITTAVISVRSG